MPEISVIVPVYNVEKYLPRCIDSILAQTFSDFELILVDDGSPDNCGAICDEYAAQDSRVIVIHQENQGVSVARNHGIDIARGRFVTFVDSDDWLSSVYLERMYDEIIKFDADMSVSNIVQVKSGEDASTRFGKRQVFDSRQAVEYYSRVYDDRFTGPMVKMFRREIAQQNPFPIDRTYAEDKAVTYKWFFHSSRIVDLEDCMYFYRVREGSAMRSGYQLNRLGNLQSLEEIITFMKQQHFDDLYILFVHRYLADLVRQYKGVIEYIGDQGVAVNLKEKMRTLVKNEKRKCSISPINDPEYYNLLYPKRMRLYWTTRSIIEILKHEGIKGVFSRIRKKGMV